MSNEVLGLLLRHALFVTPLSCAQTNDFCLSLSRHPLFNHFHIFFTFVFLRCLSLFSLPIHRYYNLLRGCWLLIAFLSIIINTKIAPLPLWQTSRLGHIEFLLSSVPWCDYSHPKNSGLSHFKNLNVLSYPYNVFSFSFPYDVFLSYFTFYCICLCVHQCIHINLMLLHTHTWSRALYVKVCWRHLRWMGWERRDVSGRWVLSEKCWYTSLSAVVTFQFRKSFLILSIIMTAILHRTQFK